MRRLHRNLRPPRGDDTPHASAVVGLKPLRWVGEVDQFGPVFWGARLRDAGPFVLAGTHDRGPSLLFTNLPPMRERLHRPLDQLLGGLPG